MATEPLLQFLRRGPHTSQEPVLHTRKQTGGKSFLANLYFSILNLFFLKAEEKEALVTCGKDAGTGFGKGQPPLPLPIPPPATPAPPGPAPTSALRPSFTTASPARRARPPSNSWRPGIPKAERRVPTSQLGRGRAAGRSAWALSLGSRARGFRGTREARKWAASRAGPHAPRAPIPLPQGLPRPGSVPSRHEPQSGRTQAPPALLTRPPQLPGSDPGRPARAAGPARARASLAPSAWPALPEARRAAAGRQRGPSPSPGQAGRPGASPRPFFPGPPPPPTLGSDPPWGQPKFSGVPNFGRRCGGSCYQWVLSGFQSQVSGSIPDATHTLHPLQSRLLPASPPPQPRRQEPQGVWGQGAETCLRGTQDTPGSRSPSPRPRVWDLPQQAARR